MDILQTKLLKLFPDPEKRSVAEGALRRYGTEPYGNEPVRVRLAVLKISGGDLDRIRRNIATAKQDYRDILSEAAGMKLSLSTILREGTHRQGAGMAFPLTSSNNKASPDEAIKQ